MRQSFNRLLGTALLSSGIALSTGAFAATQGLYSADELMAAQVYAKGNDQSIGEVEDILLGDDMSVQALAIDTGNLLDMGEKEYIIQKGKFTVQTINGDNLDDLEYRVNLDMSAQQITQQPEYTNDWWTKTKTNASKIWQNTKQNASSAWEDTKSATSNLLENASDAIDNNTDQSQNQ
ncbi:PRC-barrel domain-containing protein [Phytohalomonas tamaricis]|uniref:PRC-barrel domain-containing protein n=1 Tax=Phytohalomonas tamaricis TaxID=2081032 RepID=UPI000D0AE723|nr:PRC-barrel domain-containing protein [Phytohalomonas tamaricis]